MKIILLSGGSGLRLWPLSNDSRSKQFLKVLKKQDGSYESMVQRVWKQLERAGLAESVVIATSNSQTDMISSQLGSHIPLVVEPDRRDTFPAIALAAAYLHSVQSVNRDEVIAVLPVDPYVEDDYYWKVKELAKVLQKSASDLALMGVAPTFPSEKYGYIVPEQKTDESEHCFKAVSCFHEKPTEAVAELLISQGALWNCGVFSFKLGYLLDCLEVKGYPTDYANLLASYGSLSKISFDYEVVERAERVVVLPYHGSWKDLGTWNTLTDEMEGKEMGKGIVSNSENTHMINELDIPVVVLGVPNVVVAASPDGILVVDKHESPRIKQLVQDIKQRPMFEERRWGWYRVLDHAKLDNGQEVLTKRIGMVTGKNLSYQLHNKRSEIWTIIQGEGEFVLNDVMQLVKPGDVLKIPVQSRHAIRAVTELEFIEVQTGTELVEEDIIRLLMEWEEIEAQCGSNTNALAETAALGE